MNIENKLEIHVTIAPAQVHTYALLCPYLSLSLCPFRTTPDLAPNSLCTHLA